MNAHKSRWPAWTPFLLVVLGPAPVQAEDVAPEGDVVMEAMVDELNRSMDLRLEDLQKPYFIQYRSDDGTIHRLSAGYGALTASQDNRRRSFASRVRVGDYDLDNTNFAGGSRGGRRAVLPVDDDYVAIRQAIWAATDRDYKAAVEALTRKRAYLENKSIEDRPNDFTRTDPVVHLAPLAELDFDKQAWIERVKRISARFQAYPAIQDSQVSLIAAASTNYTVNSEGTRLRFSDTGVLLEISADLQADDGMRLADQRTFGGYALDELPVVDELLTAVDTLCSSLVETAAAPVLEEYTGPVLFNGKAAPQMFASLLARGLAGQPDPVGVARRHSDDSLDKKLGKRILPRSFQVYDDPTLKRWGTEILFGWYEYDDEAVPARRVDLVVDGVLKTQVMSRTPTKKLVGTTGHGRAARLGSDARAAVANLFICCDQGLSDEELKARLIEACQDEDLEFGLRITSMQGVGWGGLADPIHAYKIYVADGREERVRGIEFQPVEIRSLRRILAAGKTQSVFNYLSGVSAAVVAPAVLLEEIELTKIEQEFDKLPILKSPATRQPS